MDKEIALAVIAGIVALFGSKPLVNLISNIFDHLKSKKEVRTYIKMMTHLHHLQNKMKELVLRTQASRVIIFAGHNSGGLPRPSSRYYTTAVHWEIQDGSEGELHMSDYRNIPVDPIYIDMLLKSYDKNFYRYQVEKEPDSQLKRIYQAESITDSIIFFLDIHENNLIYLSTSTKDEGGFKDDEVTKIEVLAYSLKDLVRSANKDNKTN